MRADNIASKGRIGRVTAVTIGSFGRIKETIVEIAEAVRREIFRAYSRITKAIELDSLIGE